ncbi:MAG: hypothetical protein Q8L22_03520 [Reyranella sp.]|nr:hypothetical protein [Reyranella sp.]
MKSEALDRFVVRASTVCFPGWSIRLDPEIVFMTGDRLHHAKGHDRGLLY